jgi:hypothetical protein
MPHHRPIATALAASLSLAVAMPGQAGPLDDARVEPLWLSTRSTLALLTVPQGWALGDAAAVVVDGQGVEERRRAVVALVGEGAAVLTLDSHPTSSPTADAGEMVPELLGALQALRRDAGAGLVVALGHGAGGEAALMAAREEMAAPQLGRGGPRFAAAASLGPGWPAFAAGASPPAYEAWSTRAPLLCAALGSALEPSAPRARQDCIAALLGRSWAEVASLASGR